MKWRKSNFAKSFQESIDTLHVHYPDSHLRTRVGKRDKNSLYTTGKSGALVFGPFLPLKAGKYRLTIKGKVTTLDKAFVDVIANKGKIKPLRGTPLKSDNDVIFQDTFDVDTDVTDYEVRIFVGEKDNIRFDSYILEKIETGSKSVF